MKVSHFAVIQAVVPSDSDPGKAALKNIGMAQSIGIDDNFGTRAENVIGNPLPVLAPGYQQTNVNIEKATIDGADFRNLGGFNPLWAHVGGTYDDANVTKLGGLNSDLDTSDTEMYQFMFILTIKNRVSNSAHRSNITFDNKPAPSTGTGARSSSFGIYACVVQSASISMSSQQAVIMDRVSAVARPVSGTWLNKKIRRAFETTGDAKNGLRDISHSIMMGYRPQELLELR